MRLCKTTIIRIALAIALISGMALGQDAWAEPTDITVRVLSRDAKFIGSSMGGVRIVIRDGGTGAILAEGVTQGGTGNTAMLMHEGGGRRAGLSDESAAKFDATIDIAEPRLIEVEAYGPLAQPQAAHRVTSSQWVVPGHDLTGGDGWVLEMPGFVVDVLSPPAHVRLRSGAEEILIHANVAMMCGCPITPGGIWDADAYEVTALVRRGGVAVGEFPLSFAGTASQFQGTVPIQEAGTYDVTVFAHDPETGNTGLDRTTFIVQGE